MEIIINFTKISFNYKVLIPIVYFVIPAVPSILLNIQCTCVYQHDHGNNKCTYTYIFLNKICTRTLSVFDVGLLCSSRAMFVQQISLLIIIIKIFQSIIQLQCIHTAEILV